VSPELQQLLEALDAKLTCADREKPRAAATFERLLSEAMQRRPGTSRDEFLDALTSRYREFRRSRRQPPAMPRKA